MEAEEGKGGLVLRPGDNWIEDGVSNRARAMPI